MSTRASLIRQLLSQGPMKARQLIEKLNISQPTFSRALRELGDDVVRIGAGPSIQYALRNPKPGFRSTPVYHVTDEGRVKSLGELIPVRPDGFVMVQTDNLSLHSDGLPWWIYDMRPQGYLGRSYASAYSTELGLSANPEHWTDSDVVRALVAHGHDAIGNLLIGEQARNRFLEMPEPTPVERATQYPVLARAVGAGEIPGSSAGGEQPKFCTYTERGHVLVKFSAPDDNPVSERWRDLLLAEHLALKVLNVESEIFDFDGQRFLEIPRFDRIDRFGRLAVFSLRALDAEFIGNASASWPVLVNQLVAEGYAQALAATDTARLWAFGTLIGNTDMHAGNLSFISKQGPPYQLSPAYDMLPMGFAPRTGGAIINELRPASLPEAIGGDIWREALNLAEEFFAKVNNCYRFSAHFAPCLYALRRHLNDAKSRIARLG